MSTQNCVQIVCNKPFKRDLPNVLSSLIPGRVMEVTFLTTAWKMQQQRLEPHNKKQKHPQAQNVTTTMVIESGVNIPSSAELRPITRICFPQIPWLEKHGNIKDFAQSMMADVTRHSIASKDKQELYQAMCHSIPFYLPGR
jgi:hypothetical protein